MLTTTHDRTWNFKTPFSAELTIEVWPRNPGGNDPSKLEGDSKGNNININGEKPECLPALRDKYNHRGWHLLDVGAWGARWVSDSWECLFVTVNGWAILVSFKWVVRWNMYRTSQNHTGHGRERLIVQLRPSLGKHET